ncbi:MAG: thioesterase family protein, partial [Actinomycetes bacterium]
WLEAARVEFLRDLGTPYPEIRAKGLDLAVLELFTKYQRSARFDDIVTVRTRVSSMKAATFQMDYLLSLGDDTCAVAATVHGVVDPQGRATRAPDWLRQLLAGA